MKYVYLLRSAVFPDRHYTGITDDLRKRLAKHNAGEVLHTSKYKPWQLKTYLAFSDEKQALAFEKYLKSASGRALRKRGYDARCASYGSAGQPPCKPELFPDRQPICAAASRASPKS